MKKTYISLSLLMLCLLGMTASVNAQARRSSFRIDAPGAIAGYRIIEEADMAGTSPWGSSIDSAWENMTVGYDPSNPEGCTAYAPGTFTGKFALVYRGGCEFGAKALAAQNAGAVGVIIVNNLLGVAGMGGGASGASVTIPVIMVTNQTGNAMKTQIVGGTPVTISLTGWRFDSLANPRDIGFMNDGPVHPDAKAIPVHQLSTQFGNSDERFRLFSGSVFYNFSTLSWDTLFQKGVLDSRPSLISGGFSPVDSNSITWTFSTPVATTDSLLQIIIDTVNTVVEGFDMNDAAKGTYKMTNMLNIVPNPETATAFQNNDWAYEFHVNDSIYAKCNYDFSKNQPVVNSYINVAAGNTEWGPVFEFRNKNQKALKSQVVVMRGVIDDSLFTGQEVAMTLSKWEDGDANGVIDPNTELIEVGNASYILTASDIVPIGGLVLTMNMNNPASPGAPILMEQDSKYWLRVKIPGGDGNFAIGADYYSDYTANLNFGLSEGNPLFNGTMFGGGFANAGSPSIALVLSKDPESVKQFEAFNGEVKVYPNPTSDVVNIAVKLQKETTTMSYEIMDVTGKTISTSTRNNVKSDVFTYNTNKLSAGNYFVNIVTDLGKTQVKFVVAK
ncbi:MAG: T9SS type A sorting domain-containing protein [Chitinophagaceae bacterium]|nr:T9SS type A sorting domain-containing protein [Chitinophagaceae bacterium]